MTRGHRHVDICERVEFAFDRILELAGPSLREALRRPHNLLAAKSQFFEIQLH